MKKLTALLILVLITALSACGEFAPIVDERCIGHESYSFYQIESPNALGIMQDQWVLETNDGTIEIPNKVYEGAMDYEYSEICYEREDSDATVYLYTKKSDSIVPEPTIVIEYVDREVIITVTEIIFTSNIIPTLSFEGSLPWTAEVIEEVAWIGLRIVEEDLYDFTGGNEEEGFRILPEFEEKDTLIIVWLYDNNILTNDTIWKAQIMHFRSGILINSYLADEVWVSTTSSSLNDAVTEFLIEHTEDGDRPEDIQDAYNLLYPEVIE